MDWDNFLWVLHAIMFVVCWMSKLEPPTKSTSIDISISKLWWVCLFHYNNPAWTKAPSQCVHSDQWSNNYSKVNWTFTKDRHRPDHKCHKANFMFSPASKTINSFYMMYDTLQKLHANVLRRQLREGIRNTIAAMTSKMHFDAWFFFISLSLLLHQDHILKHDICNSLLLMVLLVPFFLSWPRGSIFNYPIIIVTIINTV